MSRIGKLPIEIPKGIKVEINQSSVKIFKESDPQECFNIDLPSCLSLIQESNILRLTRNSDKKKIKALHGTYRQHIANAIKGLTEGFCKELICEGMGYKLQMEGRNLRLEVGYSHPVVFKPPEGITIEIAEGNIIRVKGKDKYQVGETAAAIRRIREVEPYKLKGIRYKDEEVIRKVGKAAAGGVGKR